MKAKLNSIGLNIAIDLMGSDNDPSMLLKEIITFSKTITKPINFVFLGTAEIEDTFNDLLKEAQNSQCRLEFIITKTSITMSENPLFAIRRKKDSSISTGLRMIKEKQIDAFLTAGNTGAVVSGARMYLRPLPSISRPALMAFIPTKTGLISILDVGANVSCKAKHLIEYAKMGIVFQKVSKNTKPKVGILNIGTEERKGTEEIRKAYQELQKLASKSNDFTFVGNVEGKKVFDGIVDILLTDGFTGNIFLKTAEGVATFILDLLYSNVSKDELSNLTSHLINLKKRLHYSEYPGAILCGIDGIVIKCHGYSSPKAIINGIRGAISLAENDLISSIKSYFNN